MGDLREQLCVHPHGSSVEHLITVDAALSREIGLSADEALRYVSSALTPNTAEA
jgi:hypothetical protein